MPRPRAFDPDEALWRATLLFWEVGFEAASMQLLTEAMGINRFSLYSQFGSKRALYHAALDRYGTDIGQAMLGAMEAEGADLAAVEGFAQTFLSQLDTPQGRRGCLVVLSTSEQSPTDADTRHRTEAYRARVQAAFANALRGAAAKGQLRAGVSPDRRAAMLSVFAQGLAVQARGGAPADLLRDALHVVLSDLREPTP